MTKEFIAKAQVAKIKDIRELVNVTWESRVMPGLISISSDKSAEELRQIDGIVSCRESVTGTFNV